MYNPTHVNFKNLFLCQNSKDLTFHAYIIFSYNNLFTSFPLIIH